MMEKKLLQTWLKLNERLSNFVRQKVKDENLTKDIIQEIFIKVSTKIDQLQHEEKMISWIYQITRNEIINAFRRSKQESMDFSLPEIINDTLNEELSQCIMPMINSLPIKYKEAITLSDIQGISQKQSAIDLNISYSAYKSRVQRGREKLKNLLLECCTISYDKYGNIMDYDNNDCSSKC